MKESKPVNINRVQERRKRLISRQPEKRHRSNAVLPRCVASLLINCSSIAGMAIDRRRQPEHDNAEAATRLLALAAVLLSGLLGASMALSADAEWQPTSYKKRFEEPKQGVRLEDNNVWVYTNEFARRFGMPDRWADDDLDGAEAVAYRVEAENIRSCGFFGEPDNCRTDYRCTFDLYLSDADSQKLPWKTDRIVDYAKEDTSVPFLSAQSRSDQKGWVEEEQRYDRSRLNIGLDSMSWVGGPPRGDKVYSASSDAVRVMAYDREMFDGLDYIKLSAGCNIARRENNVRIFFQDEFPDRDDYGVSYDELVKGESNRAQKFLAYKRDWFQRMFNGDLPHIVVIPDRYMVRVREYHLTVYAPKSLATEVEQRLDGSKTDDAKKIRLK